MIANQRMSIRLIFSALLALLFACTPIRAQELRPSLGIALQAYPAGQIGVAHGTFGILDKQTISVHAGYNRTRRQDFGKHDDERGGGPGFGTTWRYYLQGQQEGLLFGARVDVWFLDIDWRWDGSSAGPLDDRFSQDGTTEITVLQPTAQVGYGWFLADERLAVEATVSLGAEINIETNGDPVGEGAILLGGVSLSYRLP